MASAPRSGRSVVTGPSVAPGRQHVAATILVVTICWSYHMTETAPDVLATARARHAPRSGTRCSRSRPTAWSRPSARTAPSTASTSRSPRARSSACSAPTAPARPRCCRCSPRCCRSTAATAEIFGDDVRTPAPRGAPARRRHRPVRLGRRELSPAARTSGCSAGSRGCREEARSDRRRAARAGST